MSVRDGKVPVSLVTQSGRLRGFASVRERGLVCGRTRRERVRAIFFRSTEQGSYIGQRLFPLDDRECTIETGRQRSHMRATAMLHIDGSMRLRLIVQLGKATRGRQVTGSGHLGGRGMTARRRVPTAWRAVVQREGKSSLDAPGDAVPFHRSHRRSCGFLRVGHGNGTLMTFISNVDIATSPFQYTGIAK
jgi:hypothetical protein